MGVVQYDHISGDKLTQRQLDDKEARGWKIMHHNCSASDVHYYIFRKEKE
jgi:hypothetical protein